MFRSADGGILCFLISASNPGERNNYFVDMYQFILDFDDKDVKVQDKEVLEFSIATIDEVKQYAKQGIFLHYDSIRQIFED